MLFSECSPPGVSKKVNPPRVASAFCIQLSRWCWISDAPYDPAVPGPDKLPSGPIPIIIFTNHASLSETVLDTP